MQTTTNIKFTSHLTLLGLHSLYAKAKKPEGSNLELWSNGIETAGRAQGEEAAPPPQGTQRLLRSSFGSSLGCGCLCYSCCSCFFCCSCLDVLWIKQKNGENKGKPKSREMQKNKQTAQPTRKRNQTCKTERKDIKGETRSRKAEKQKNREAEKQRR